MLTNSTRKLCFDVETIDDTELELTEYATLSLCFKEDTNISGPLPMTNIHIIDNDSKYDLL